MGLIMIVVRAAFLWKNAFRFKPFLLRFTSHFIYIGLVEEINNGHGGKRLHNQSICYHICHCPFHITFLGFFSLRKNVICLTSHSAMAKRTNNGWIMSKNVALLEFWLILSFLLKNLLFFLFFFLVFFINCVISNIPKEYLT